MSTGIIVLIAVIIGVVVIGAIWMYSQSQRKRQLREDFGPEYDRMVAESASKKQAEKELEAREKRVERLHLKDLTPDQSQRFAEQWRLVQGHFVDSPTGAIGEADSLIISLMEARGYPVTDFDQRAADISVDHPEVVQNYRAAHTIAEINAKDGASTEDLRQAMVHYRSLFDELAGVVTARSAS